VYLMSARYWAGAWARKITALILPAAFILFLAGPAACPARADIGIVLNESLDTSVARITGSGHSAVYLSHVCAESPVKLRPCRPGEMGSVISNYTTLGEDQPFEWNVVPLSIYLYGVEDPADRPLFVSFEIKHLLEERYREKYLAALCAGEFCRKSGKAEWREMVGASLERSLYIFAVDTTPEQDLRFIAEMNAASNVNHFNGVTRNCANFAERLVNTYFPHSVGADYINDFGMTSPKAIARSLTRYVGRHPELELRVIHVAQVPGTFKRSTEARAGTEQLFHSKKFLVPMLVFADYGIPVAAGSYFLTGRFNPERQFEEHPAVLERDSAAVVSGRQPLNAETFVPVTRASAAGTRPQWKEYRREFQAMLAEYTREEDLPRRPNAARFFKRLNSTGVPFLGPGGAVWMRVSQGGHTSTLGLSESNILARESNPRLAYRLLLARMETVLKSPKHSRETMTELEEDWGRLRSASVQSMLAAHPLPAPPSASSAQTRSGETD
ncbi:MAG TPA: hypothetical protein VEH49_08835, partial [Methylomirabilota bacterium]|nr:hypothetical protein [Methylomirabilota bacterium]